MVDKSKEDSRFEKGIYSRMKKMEKDCPDSWTFEQDINKVIHDNYKRKWNKFCNITTLIIMFLVIVIYYFLSNYYGDNQKAGKIVMGFKSVGIGVLCLEIWFLNKRKVKKYWPMIIFPVIALLIVIAVIYIYSEGNMSLQSADILSFCGDYLAFLGTFCLGYFIYIQDCLKVIEEKRTKVRLLITLMENANTELLNLSHLVRNETYIPISENRNRVKHIPYNSDWILYYCEYEALKGENPDLRHTLDSFFGNIMSVNAAIELGQIEKANEINRNHIDCGLYSTNKYNELEAIVCLRDACSDFHFDNTKCWIEREETIDLINELCKKYYFVIENYVYVWLLKHNVVTTTEKDDLNHEIVDWLLLNSPEIKEKIRYPSEKRIISKMVFDCSLKFSCKSKKVNYVWGEYSLK